MIESVRIGRSHRGRNPVGGFFDEGEAMPRKPKRPCRYGGCPNLTGSKSGYCEKHEKPMQRYYERFARGYRQHERYGSVWRKFVTGIWHENRCARCAKSTDALWRRRSCITSSRLAMAARMTRAISCRSALAVTRKFTKEKSRPK